MNRKDPDKKGKAFGIYLTAEAKKVYLATPDKEKGKMVSRAIVAWNNRCEHVWTVPNTEAICEKCGVRMNAIIERVKL